jgi:tRNA (cytidine/uridine-2'-O-)-methyltransferase
VVLLHQGVAIVLGCSAGGRDKIDLVFGRETGGLPAELHERFRDRFVSMPILSPRVRSLNLSTSVGIALYEVLRQRRGEAGSTGK